jgi:branched-chain amino acid transport system substrate-binding protein
MKVKNGLFLVIVFLASVFFTNANSSQAKEVRGVSDNLIKIGVICDHTGPAAMVTFPIATGIKTSVRYINDQGGVNGRKLKVIAEDDRYSIPAAISAYKKLIYKDEIFALFGPGSASFLPPLVGKFQKDKLPTMSMVFSEIAVKPHKEYIFIVCDIYEGQIRTLIDYIIKDYKLKNPRIGIVYPDTEAGKVDLGAALPRLKEYNIEPVTKEVLMAGAVDASSQVMSLKKNGVNCIMHIGTITPTAVTLVRELKKFGLKIPVFNSWGAMLAEGLNEIGDAASQAYVIHPISPWYGEGPGVENMRKVTLKYFPGTEKPYRGTGFGYGWGYVLVFAEGLKKAGRNLDEDALVKALEGLKDYDTGGLLAPITFSSKSHRGANASKIYKANPDAGKYVALTGWRKSD